MDWGATDGRLRRVGCYFVEGLGKILVDAFRKDVRFVHHIEKRIKISAFHDFSAIL